MRPRLAVVLSTYRIVLRSPVLSSPFKYIIVNAFDIAITYHNRLFDLNSHNTLYRISYTKNKGNEITVLQKKDLKLLM